jgi:hypothetical protein
MSEVIRFQFPESAVREEVEGDACLAIFSAECLYGRPQTLLEAAYLVAADGRSMVLRVSGVAGDTATRVLIGLCAERFGDGGFRVARSVEEAGA